LTITGVEGVGRVPLIAAEAEGDRGDDIDAVVVAEVAVGD